MKCLNLTDIDLDLKQSVFDHLARVDHLFVGSKVISKEQIIFLKSLGIERAIDLKGSNETDFDDQSEFTKQGVEYIHFPITDLGNINFSQLEEFGKLINHHPAKTLVYCASGNRVGALLALNSCLICGHPKQRAFDFGVKIGMNRGNTQEFVHGILLQGGFEDNIS